MLSAARCPLGSTAERDITITRARAKSTKMGRGEMGFCISSQVRPLSRCISMRASSRRIMKMKVSTIVALGFSGAALLFVTQSNAQTKPSVSAKPGPLPQVGARVPVLGKDGLPLKNDRGQVVSYVVRGMQKPTVIPKSAAPTAAEITRGRALSKASTVRPIRSDQEKVALFEGVEAERVKGKSTSK